MKYFLDGGSWASSAFNRHLYNSSGQLASGTVLDRDGDVLSEVVDGQRTYYDNATVRKATLHAVGDLQGNIGTGALNAFADKLTGYSLLNGAFGAQRGNDLYLTIDARYNYTAYEALGGKSGTVAAKTASNGFNSYLLVACPLFTFAGDIMAKGGISKRLIAVAKLLIGNMTGGLGIVSI